MSRNKDSEILYYVREFHLVTEAHLQILTGRNTLWRRLPVLVEQKKLYRTRRGRYSPYVYAGYNITKRKEFNHDLLITDIHIAMHQTGSLLEWKQPKDKKEGALNEDAYCVLAVSTAEVIKELHCFIEADNSSEPDWQIREKIERYISYYSRHKKPFRVLFVAPDEQRRQELVKVSNRAVPKEVNKMFLFANNKNLKADPLAPICSICHGKHLISLLPVVSATTTQKD